MYQLRMVLALFLVMAALTAPYSSPIDLSSEYVDNLASPPCSCHNPVVTLSLFNSMLMSLFTCLLGFSTSMHFVIIRSLTRVIVAHLSAIPLITCVRSTPWISFRSITDTAIYRVSLFCSPLVKRTKPSTPTSMVSDPLVIVALEARVEGQHALIAHMESVLIACLATQEKTDRENYDLLLKLRAEEQSHAATRAELQRITRTTHQLEETPRIPLENKEAWFYTTAEHVSQLDRLLAPLVDISKDDFSVGQQIVSVDTPETSHSLRSASSSMPSEENTMSTLVVPSYEEFASHVPANSSEWDVEYDTSFASDILFFTNTSLSLSLPSTTPSTPPPTFGWQEELTEKLVANVKDLEATVDSLTKLLSTKTKIIINLEMSKMENGLKVESLESQLPMVAGETESERASIINSIHAFTNSVSKPSSEDATAQSQMILQDSVAEEANPNPQFYKDDLSSFNNIPSVPVFGTSAMEEALDERNEVSSLGFSMGSPQPLRLSHQLVSKPTSPASYQSAYVPTDHPSSPTSPNIPLVQLSPPLDSSLDLNMPVAEEYIFDNLSINNAPSSSLNHHTETTTQLHSPNTSRTISIAPRHAEDEAHRNTSLSEQVAITRRYSESAVFLLDMEFNSVQIAKIADQRPPSADSSPDMAYPDGCSWDMCIKKETNSGDGSFVGLELAVASEGCYIPDLASNDLSFYESLAF